MPSFRKLFKKSSIVLLPCLLNIPSTMAYDFTDNQPYSQLPPQNLLPAQVPLFFSIGFDDNGISGINGSGGTGGMTWILDYLRNKKNPVSIGNLLTYDSTPVRVSFFNSSKYHEGTVVDDSVFIKRAWNTAYTDGHEIGLHTVNHLHGSDFNSAQWSSEIGDTVAHLSKPFNISEIPGNLYPASGMGADPLKLIGFRTPFLEYNNEMFSVLVQQGYTYDTSIEEGWEYTMDGSNYPWPYTLNQGSPGNQYMLDSGFPNKEPLSSRPGLWELGVNPLIVPPDNLALQYGVDHSIRDRVKQNMPWFDLAGGKITGFDYNLWGLAKLDKTETLAVLKYTLDLRLQNGNRAPFMLGAHTDYFASKNASLFPHISVRERQEVIEEFIDYAQSKPEVRIVPFVSVLNWMRNPSAIDCSVNCSVTFLPPMVINPGNQSNEVETAIELAIGATDPNNFELSFSAENLPTGLSIDTVSGVIRGIATTESNNSVIVTVNNGEEISSINFNWQIVSPSVSSDLVAHWLLNEGTGTVATDSSNNGYNGTLTNGPAWNGNNLVFDGVNDYINLGNLDISGSALTLASWVQADDLENCTYRDCRILSKASSASGQDHYWMISTIKVGSETRLRFRLKAGGITSTLVASSGNILNGDHFHVAATYDGITMRLYKDSIEVGSRAKTGNIDTNAGVEAWIGGNPTIASSRPWKGSIADVHVYRSALSVAEVNAIKDATTVIVDTTPPIIQNIQTIVTNTTATITWNTNEAANGQVIYGVTNTYGETRTDATISSTHSLVLTGLTPSSLYHYQVSSADASGNISSSGDLTLTTADAVDIVPPVISNVQVSVTDTSATIVWMTNELANSQVFYGLTSEYGETRAIGTMVTAHSLILTGLTPNTLYHYRVSSTDANSNSSSNSTDNLIFTTIPTPNVNDNLIAHWLLNEGSGSIANDSSNNGHNGTLINNPVWNGNNLVFDGVDDYVNLGSLDISGTAITLAGWVQADVLENCRSKDCRILSKASSTSGQDHYWMISTIKVGSATRLRFRLKAGGITTTLVASTGNILNGDRFHFAATFDGTTMRLYKDGLEVGSRAKTGNIDTNASVEAWIGGNPTVASSRPWKGSISDVRIYQSALSVVEVNAIKDATTVIVDTTPPDIQNIQAAVTNTTATVTWNTNEAANSQVVYGLTNDHGETSTDASMNSAHSLTLTGLTSGSLYHYQVSSTDSSGNISTSEDLTINTAEQVDIAPPVISNIQVTVTDTTATITWSTNELTNSQVFYGLTNDYGETSTDASINSAHSLTLTGLTSGSLYHYQVSSADSSGNMTTSDDLTISTAEVVDIVPPVISNIQVTVTDTTATVTWNTNELADTQVFYGLTNGYGETSTTDLLVTAHSQILTGLTADTLYHYRVNSTDASSNSSSDTTDNLSFTTSSTASGNNNLVAHWLLNEGAGTNASDSSNNGHNGTLTNNPVWNGNNLVFDGVNDYVNLGTFDISGSKLTLAGWVQADALENCTSRDCRILSKASSTSGQDHYWMISTIKVGNATRLRFRLKAGGITTTLVASSGNILNGDRFHVAATYDGTTMRLYKDGIEVGSRAKTGNIDTNAGVEAWIGGNPTIANSRPWKGIIADIHIYQSALTVAELNTIRDAYVMTAQ